MKIGQYALGIGSICSVISQTAAIPTPQNESSVNPNQSPNKEEAKYFRMRTMLMLIHPRC